MHIISIDPGSHTGVVYGDTESGEMFCREYSIGPRSIWPANEQRLVISIHYISKLYQFDVMIIEDFVLRPGMVSTKREVLSPARIGFAISMYVPCRSNNPQIVWAPPSEMAVMNNERLRDAGFWVEGSEHCRDAMRHWLLYCRKNRIDVGKCREKNEKMVASRKKV